MKNFLRWFIGTIVGFTLFIAVLQTKWAKIKINEQLTALLKKEGIDVTLQEVDGRLPLTWSIEKISHQDIVAEKIQLRIAFLPLLKGNLSFNYISIDQIHLKKSQSSFEIPLTKETIENTRQETAKLISKLHIPLTLSIHHFSIGKLCCDQLICSAEGKGRWRKDNREFFLDLSLFPLFEAKPLATMSVKGSRLENKISVHVNTTTPFLFDVSLEGPWESWDDLIYATKTPNPPLQGKAKCRLPYPLTVASSFTLSSLESIYLQKITLANDQFRLKGKGLLNIDPMQSKGVFSYSLPHLSHFYPIDGSASGKGYFNAGKLNLSFQTHKLGFSNVKLGDVKGSIVAAIDSDHWTGKVHLTDKEKLIPFEGSFGFDFLPNKQVSIDSLAFKTQEGSVSGNVTYFLDSKLFSGDLFAEVLHLEYFAPLLREERINGAFSLECHLQQEEMKLSLQAQNLRFQDYVLDALNVDAELHDSSEGKLSLEADKFFSPTFQINHLAVNTSSSDAEWPFLLKASGTVDDPFQFKAEGAWKKQKDLFTLHLDKCEGALFDYPFSLKESSTFELDQAHCKLTPFHLGVANHGNLSLDFDLSPTHSKGNWNFEHFPLKFLSIFQPRFSLKGFLSAQGFIDATEDNIEGLSNAILEEADVLHFGNKKPFMAKGSLQAHLNHQTLQIHSHIKAAKQQFLDFSGSFPIEYQLFPFSLSLNPSSTFAAELIAEGKLQDIFDFVNLGIHHLSGFLSARLFLSQNLENPAIQGKLNWEQGTYENDYTGTSLRDISAEFEADGDLIKMTRFTALDREEGEVEGEGKIQLSLKNHFPYSFNAELDDLHTLSFSMMDCNFTGPLYIKGTTEGALAQGNLIVTQATIRIPEELPYEVPTLPIVYVNRPAHLSSTAFSSLPTFPFKIDLELTTKEVVEVQGKGLKSEWQGNVRLTGTNTDISAHGVLSLIKGEFAFLGKAFKLTEGEISFNDKPHPSAYLQLSGEMNLFNATITANLQGPLTAPKLTLQSNPQMPTSSILALILFNKDISDISHPEAIQLAGALISLSGGAGPDVLETIRKTIGVDRLTISSASPGSDEIAIQVGKYLIKGVLITLSQSATSSKVIVEVELPKGFIFQAETQDEYEGKFSLKWTKSY